MNTASTGYYLSVSSTTSSQVHLVLSDAPQRAVKGGEAYAQAAMTAPSGCRRYDRSAPVLEPPDPPQSGKISSHEASQGR